MSIQIKKKATLPCARVTLSARFFVTILTVSASPAWAFDTYQGTIAEPVREMLSRGNTPLTAKSPSPSMMDMCLPLLNSIHHIPSNSVMDRNQRSAGEAAAIGLVFGVRFALTPLKKPSVNARNKASARFDVWHPQGSHAGNRQALAVSAYRQCQKEQALKALSAFQWKR